VSLQRSQLAKPAEQLGKSSRRVATPEPATAQMPQRALEQARHVLQVIEAGPHSRKRTASGSMFLISPAAMLDLLANEFKKMVDMLHPSIGKRLRTRQQLLESSTAC